MTHGTKHPPPESHPKSNRNSSVRVTSKTQEKNPSLKEGAGAQKKKNNKGAMKGYVI